MAFAQATAFPNTRASRDCLDTAYVADNLKFHLTIVSERGGMVNVNPLSCLPIGMIRVSSCRGSNDKCRAYRRWCGVHYRFSTALGSSDKPIETGLFDGCIVNSCQLFM
jgi:hypothetical protein